MKLHPGALISHCTFYINIDGKMSHSLELSCLPQFECREIISATCLLCILLNQYPLMIFYHKSRWLAGRKEALQEVISSSVCPTQFQSTSYDHFSKNSINSIIIILCHLIDKNISVIPGNCNSDNCSCR